MTTLLKRLTILSVFLACGLLAAQAQARQFTEGTFYVVPKVGMYANSNDRISSMFSYGAEAGYFLIDGFSLGVEGQGYIITQKRNPWWSGNGNYETVSAFSPIAIGRYHFINEDKYSVFVGAGLGGFFSQVNVPRNGYSSNLTEVVETGFSVNMNQNLSLMLAGRWQHIGEFSNKGSDNWGGNVGLKYAF